MYHCRLIGLNKPGRLSAAVCTAVVLAFVLWILFRKSLTPPTEQTPCQFPADATAYGQGEEDAALYERYFC
eukprot:SAG31_NODE_37187_length_306_cov_1.000000_1_plen_70_part_10